MYEFYKPELRSRKMETNGQSLSWLPDSFHNDCINSWRRCVSLWTGTFEDLYRWSSGYQLWYGDPSVYNSYLFSVRMDGSVPGISSWNGKINCADDTFRNRNSRNENRLDLWNISKIQIIEDFVYFLSGILDHYDHPAGDLLYFCQKNRLCATEKTRGCYIMKKEMLYFPKYKRE